MIRIIRVITMTIKMTMMQIKIFTFRLFSMHIFSWNYDVKNSGIALS